MLSCRLVTNRIYNYYQYDAIEFNYQYGSIKFHYQYDSIKFEYYQYNSIKFNYPFVAPSIPIVRGYD